MLNANLQQDEDKAEQQVVFPCISNTHSDLCTCQTLTFF